MPRYYPSSQIETNLYTNGGEYITKITETNYIGFYHKTSDGKRYIGKTSNNINPIEIIPTPTTDPTLLNSPTLLSTPLTLANDQPKYPGPYTDFDTSFYSDNLNTSFTNRYPPTPYYAQPTEEEEEIGEYRRYFAKKTNTLVYIEISKETYTKFKSKDPTVAFDLYECLNLPWSLTDNSDEINKNIVSLIERNNKWDGFSLYFKGDFFDARSTKRNNTTLNKKLSPSTSTPSSTSSPSGGGGGGY
tara:strand:+ start:4619 stop:5353 length:735 start_codon:yes stop_codon:yes gene_type:complete